MTITTHTPEEITATKRLAAEQIGLARKYITKSLGEHASAIESLTQITNQISESARQARQYSEDIDKIAANFHNSLNAALSSELIGIIEKATSSLVLPRMAQRVLELVEFGVQDGEGLDDDDAATVLQVIAALLGFPNLKFAYDPKTNRETRLLLADMSPIRQAVAAYPYLADVLPTAANLAEPPPVTPPPTNEELIR